MKRIAAALAVVAFLGAMPRGVLAQPLRGFTTVSINGEQNGQTFSGASGGVLLDLADAWLSVGAEADLFVAWPYFAGRVGPLVQVNVVRHAPVRVFAIAGHSWGEQAGPMIGGGVEFRTRRRVGFRATVQDYLARVPAIDCSRFGIDPQHCNASFHGGQSWVLHQPTVQFGLVWR
jgi:hypothetical protein